jgi:predicted nucleic acid-binding protein
MTGFMPDSNCIVAAVSAWHEHYERAGAEIERRLTRGENLLLAAHSLVEAYSVLTRLPGRRLNAETAWSLLKWELCVTGTGVGVKRRGIHTGPH